MNLRVVCETSPAWPVVSSLPWARHASTCCRLHIPYSLHVPVRTQRHIVGERRMQAFRDVFLGKTAMPATSHVQIIFPICGHNDFGSIVRYAGPFGGTPSFPGWAHQMAVAFLWFLIEGLIAFYYAWKIASIILFEKLLKNYSKFFYGVFPVRVSWLFSVRQSYYPLLSLSKSQKKHLRKHFITFILTKI